MNEIFWINRQTGQKADNMLHRYHLKDVIVGKIYFLLVRIKIKHMELSIIRRETTGARQSDSPSSDGSVD